MKIGRNEKCPCGSGKKYKKCCLGKSQNIPAFESQDEWNEWIGKVSKLPFRAEVISKDGSECSMKVSSAKIIRDGQEEILFKDEIELKTNSVNGDEIEHSNAIFIVPQNNEEPKVIKLGNASISNTTQIIDISLSDNKKKLKVKSKSGLWASAKIGLQRDTGQKYFQLFFGIEGKDEIIDSSGMKNRPHIDFFPSGNGKFIRLSDFRCKLEFESGYNKEKKVIFPSKAKIVIEDHNENLEIDFEYEANKATLIEMIFKNKM
jgi:hypothetical protein